MNESDPRSDVHYLGSSENKAWKKFQACTGFEPMTSAIPVQRSTNWANKPTGSWSWWWSVNPWSDEYTVKSIWKSYIFQAMYMFMTLWPVWGYFRVDQPTSTCFKWHTSISVYLQRTLDCSNSHERRWSTRNLNDKHTIWRLINFFLKDDNQRRDFSSGYCL